MKRENIIRAQVVYTPDTYAKLQKVAEDMDMTVSGLCKMMISVGLQNTYGIRLSDVDIAKKPKPKAKKSPTV